MKHLEWIESIVSLIGNEAVTQDQIRQVSKHDRCELGRWFESEAAAEYQDFSEFERLKESHKVFHGMAGELILALDQGDEAQALDSQEKFIAMSQEVIAYLSALQAHCDRDHTR